MNGYVVNRNRWFGIVIHHSSCHFVPHMGKLPEASRETLALMHLPEVMAIPWSKRKVMWCQRCSSPKQRESRRKIKSAS